jgi:hypothetical protein
MPQAQTPDLMEYAEQIKSRIGPDNKLPEDIPTTVEDIMNILGRRRPGEHNE